MAPDGVTEILLRLDAQARDIQDLKKLGEETHAQTVKTNGRVTKLERDAEVEAALSKQRAEMDASHRRKWEFVRPASAALLSGAVLLVGQHFIT